MKHITITGPHAAGKDTIIAELLNIFKPKYGGQIKKVLFITSRKPRKDEKPNVDALFTTEQEFLQMRDSGELFYWVQLPGYYVGTLLSQLKGADILIHNIILEGAKALEKSGPVFKIALNAPYEQRKKRVLSREPQLTNQQAEQKLIGDPRADIERHYKEFDLVVENPDGELNETIQTIKAAVENFLVR